MKSMIVILGVACTVTGCATNMADVKAEEQKVQAENPSLFPDDSTHENAGIKSVEERVKFEINGVHMKITRLGDINRLGQQVTSMTMGPMVVGRS